MITGDCIDHEVSSPDRLAFRATVGVITVANPVNTEKGLEDLLSLDFEVGQSLKPDIKVVLDRLREKKGKPPWDEVALWSGVSKALWNQWDRLCVIDSVSHRKYVTETPAATRNQIIVPRAMREHVVKLIHEGIGVSHLGRSKTEGAVSQRAYWVGWSGEVRRTLQKCEVCVRFHRGTAPLRTPLKPILCGEPWEIVSIDITGPHPTSKDGFSWILTLQDHFSKWVEAFPLRRHTAPIVARTLFDRVFS